MYFCCLLSIQGFDSLSIAVVASLMVFSTLRPTPSEIQSGIHDVSRISGPVSLNNELN